MIGTCDQSNEFLLVHMSASMFKLSVIEVRIVRLEHVSIDFAAAWSYLVVCVVFLELALKYICICIHIL